MAQISLRLDDDLLDELEAEADEANRSRSDYIQIALRDRHESERVDTDVLHGLARELRECQRQLADERRRRERAEAERADVQAVARELREREQELAEEQARRESAEAARDDLRRQLSAVNSREDDVGELVEYVERERSLMERREARERAREEASVLRRFKWWLVGRSPVDDEQRDE